jgi:hypothetical protein
MSNGQTFTVWQINIEPSSFPIAGDLVLAQIPSSNLPGNGWFFVFACIGTPSDPEFATQIGPESYTFNVENRDDHAASGTVTTAGQNGTWSAEGSVNNGGPGL